MSGTRTIFAMGGGGFTMEPDNPMLDDFVLGLAAARQPRILFLPTASGDPAAQIAAFDARVAERACAATHLSLFRLHGSRRPLRDVVLEQDVEPVRPPDRQQIAHRAAADVDHVLIEHDVAQRS